MPVGEESVVADAAKAVGQNVKQKPANELTGGERHRLAPLSPVLAIIFPAKGGMFVRHFDEAAVTEGDAVSVAREIGQHLFRPGDWALGRRPRVCCRQQVGREAQARETASNSTTDERCAFLVLIDYRDRPSDPLRRGPQ